MLDRSRASTTGSDATVEVTLDELTSGEFAVTVHQSNEEASVYIACGDITV